MDFKNNSEVIRDLVITGESVDKILEYKYLDTVLEHKLTFDSSTRVI